MKVIDHCIEEIKKFSLEVEIRARIKGRKPHDMLPTVEELLRVHIIKKYPAIIFEDEENILHIIEEIAKIQEKIY